MRKFDGVQVHSLSTAGGIDEADAEPVTGTNPTARSIALKKLGSRIGKHFYWTDDGDFLIFGKLPQSLAGRAAAKLDTPLAGWHTSHHYPGAHSLLGFTATSRDAQRSSYYGYLQVLQILDDLSGGAVDLSAMPAAHTLKLPRSGAIGASLGVTADTLSLKLNYEQQPLELIGADSTATTAVAMTAIVAASALPAYQEY